MLKNLDGFFMVYFMQPHLYPYIVLIDIQSQRSDSLNLEWNVYTHDFNGKKIKVFNIFNHGRFLEDVKKDLKKCEAKEEFAEKLRGHLFYYYGSKCEWEVVITSWTPHITISELNRLNAERDRALKEHNREPYSLYVNPDVAEKVDVYSQVLLNWDVFVEYVWSHKRRKRNESAK